MQYLRCLAACKAPEVCLFNFLHSSRGMNAKIIAYLHLLKSTLYWNLLCVLSRLNTFRVSFNSIILLVISLMLWYVLRTGCWPYRWHKGDQYLIFIILLRVTEHYRSFSFCPSYDNDLFASWSLRWGWIDAQSISLCVRFFCFCFSHCQCKSYKKTSKMHLLWRLHLPLGLLILDIYCSSICL